MNKVWAAQLGHEGGRNGRDQDYTLRHVRPHEVQGSRQDDDIEDVIDQTCRPQSVSWVEMFILDSKG